MESGPENSPFIRKELENGCGKQNIFFKKRRDQLELAVEQTCSSYYPDYCNLDNLPNSLLQGNFECYNEAGEKAPDGMELANSIIKGNARKFLDKLRLIEALASATNYNFKRDNFHDCFHWIYQIKTYIPISMINTDKKQNVLYKSSALADQNHQYVIVSLSLLHLIILTRKTDILKHLLKKQILLEHWTKPIKFDKTNMFKKHLWIRNANCFHLAAKHYPEGLQLLLDHIGFDMIEDIFSDGKTTPLHVAANRLDSQSTSILLHHGAPVDCKDPRGYTALFYACKDGHLPNVISLIDNGANVNHKAEGGKTPLFRARSVNTILLLLGYGADPNLKMDDNDLTASEYLIRYSTYAQAIMDECITLDENDNLIVDFHAFSKQNDQESEMSLFVEDRSWNQGSLMIHPLLQLFLSLKFETIAAFFAWKFMFILMFVFFVNVICMKYVALVSCEIIDIGYKNNLHLSLCKGIPDVQYCFTNGPSLLLEDTFKGCLCNGTFSTITADERLHDIKCNLKTGLLETPPESDVTLETALGESYFQKIWTWNWLYVWIHVILILYCLKEVDELLHTITNITKSICHYFTKSLENWIEVALIIASWTFMFGSRINIIFGMHSAAWMVFLAWISLMLHLRNFNTIGHYILILVHVTKTMLFCLLPYMPIFFAFSIGFFILLRPTILAPINFFHGFLRVMVMMTGELNYEDNYENLDDFTQGDGINTSIKIMFILFLIMVALIVNNLLIAVTVSKTDFQALLTKSEYELAQRKVNYIKNIYQSLFFRLLRKSFHFFPFLKTGKEHTNRLLDRLKRECNFKVCILNKEIHQQPFISKIDGLLRNVQYKEVYMFSLDEEKKRLNLRIRSSLFQQTVDYIKQYEDYKKQFGINVSEIRENSRRHLYELVNGNSNAIIQLMQKVDELKDLLNH